MAKKKKSIKKQTAVSILENEAMLIMKSIESIRPMYKRLDEITEILEARGFTEGKKLVMIDNFEKKNTAFRTVSLRRFQLERK